MNSYQRLVLGVFLCMLSGIVPQAYAQSLYLNAGVVLNDKFGGTVSETNAVTQLGVQFWVTNLFEVRAGVAFQEELMGEIGLNFHPFQRNWRLEPYLFGSFGTIYDFNDNVRESFAVAAIGLGVSYAFNDKWMLRYEAGVRPTAYKAAQGQVLAHDGVQGILGVVYNLGGSRPEPYRPPAVEVDSTAEGVGQMGRPAFVINDSTSLPLRDDMVLVPGGQFVMGLADEDPLSLQTSGFKRVTVSSFWIDRDEVTNEEYRSYISELDAGLQQAALPDSAAFARTGNRFGFSEYFRGSFYNEYPVVAVTWDQASDYCQFYSKRLPTEGEWEYIARSGQIGGVYPWDGLEAQDRLGRYLANFNPNRGGYSADGYAFTAPREAYPPTRWGLYNVSGNVAEWVQDAYSPTYSVLADFNPVYADPNEDRHVIRGGSWASDAFYIGVGVRDAQPKSAASPYIGFRCAQDISDLGN